MFWGKDKEPFIIAELSANHNGSIERAFESIKVAKECGASAIKIQTYTADTMTIKSDRDEFKVKSGIWSGSPIEISSASRLLRVSSASEDML